ncbi:LysR family transcriptional regulator [Brucella anthropi]|uniref:LysR family transcriptional regulator n=1 Tax=Brucella anthropi TaxID=529 RepID=UPI00124ED387|nr:LysR family transcriptional regulator [Brucella anthropi]KAB2784177.1 LysR family transcriptional regulator [Brucella anthropi]KAB2793113.1 LysR family transcriptional regulator [Brucella anthropi]
MELRHLRYFVAVAEEGSFNRAAERLHIQQPPLGQQIRDLEYELGVALFDRNPRRVTLNEAGQLFLTDARDILDRAGRAVTNVQRFDKGETGKLSVGFTSSASFHFMAPEVLRRFRADYPAAEIEVAESETYELILGLDQGRLDVAFLHIGAEGFPALCSEVLSQEDMLVAIPRDHPLAAEPSVPLALKMLNGVDFVVYRRPDGPGIFDGVMDVLKRNSISPNTVDTVSRIIAAINLVAGGRGVTMVPASMNVLHKEAVVYRRVVQGDLKPLPLYAISRKDNRLAIVRNFLSIIRRLKFAELELINPGLPDGAPRSDRSV